MRVDQVATVRNEQDGRPRTRRDERREFARDAVAEHGGREFVDFAADDERVGGIDKRSGLQGEHAHQPGSVHCPAAHSSGSAEAMKRCSHQDQHVRFLLLGQADQSFERLELEVTLERIRPRRDEHAHGVPPELFRPRTVLLLEQGGGSRVGRVDGWHLGGRAGTWSVLQQTKLEAGLTAPAAAVGV